MSKPIEPQQAVVFCGIDVSAATLAVAVCLEDQRFEERVFDNTAGGHKALIGWLRKSKAPGRVSLEATGIYSLDLALALNQAEGIEVAVLNPKLTHRFAQTLRRSKTDSAENPTYPYLKCLTPKRESCICEGTSCDCSVVRDMGSGPSANRRSKAP
jgi:transposase